ncbi:MAG: hypothetical protein DRP87_02395 [Spirochaetes bacterium]|nr:MAG: hypothetical protein DRP87_02395 [Spirochaetota bacterium]
MKDWSEIFLIFAEVVVLPLSLILLWTGTKVFRESHPSPLRLSGWSGIALYSLTALMVSLYYLEPVVAVGQVLGTIFIIYMIAFELGGGSISGGKSDVGSDSSRGTRREGRARLPSNLYWGRVISSALLFNFLFSHITFITVAVVYISALLSLSLPVILGMDVSLKLYAMGNSIIFKTRYIPEVIGGNLPEVQVQVLPTDVAVVYGCSGIREILFALFAILFTGANGEKKRRAFSLSFFLVFFSNILRNNLVIGLYGSGLSSFETAHSLIGSLVVLAGITGAAIVCFFLVPETAEHLSALFRLSMKEGA